MTEQQLRDVLARVVPEPPDSVADAAPAIRAARRQRRVATTVVGGVAVLAVVGGVLGVQALRADDGPDFADEPAQIADPYTTAPCPALTQPWPDGAIENLDAVQAVRFCGRPGDDPTFLPIEGPSDALVVGLDAFAAAVRDLPEADPARCAAVSIVPTDSRVLLQLSDGTQVTVESGSCGDVDAEGRVVEGHGIWTALYTGLEAQRDDHEYATSETSAPTDCNLVSLAGPVQTSSSHLVAATWCGPNSSENGGTAVDADTVTRLDEAWRSAKPSDPEDMLECSDYAGGSGEHILARTDRGDVVDLRDQGCDRLGFSPSSPENSLGVSGTTLSLDFAIGDLAKD